MRPLLASMLLALSAAAPAQSPREARFDWFDYSGTDATSPAELPPGQFRNPILAGFYPDPSITRVGDDYYLVHSTFSWFPGIPIFHSRDLVSWTQVGNAIHRPEQLDFKRLGLSRGVFAPAIEHHRGRFYIVNTCVDCGGNFVVTATDPKGPWSDPVWLPEVDGIDPSIFFDDDGSAWLLNNGPPIGTPRYDGHRAIWIQRFDPKTLKTFGPRKMLVDGGVDISEKPMWIEGPHIFRHEGRYYMSAAEGGTSVNHSQVIFRADRPDGPWTPAPKPINPILTQRDLGPARPDPITSAGHADLVKLPDGSWWASFLATRPYAGNFYNTGRETFLLPVTWKDGWPNILPAGKPIPTVLPRPNLAAAPPPAVPTSGSFRVREEFDGAALPIGWMTMRSPPSGWMALREGALVLTPGAEGLGDMGRPAFVARRQQHRDAVAETVVRLAGRDGDEAGIAALQSDTYHLALGLVRTGGATRVQLRRRAGEGEPANGAVIASAPLTVGEGGPVHLRVTARGGRYDFGYAVEPGRWTMLAKDVDGTILSTETAGGFVGTMIGPYAVAAKRK